MLQDVRENKNIKGLSFQIIRKLGFDVAHPAFRHVRERNFGFRGSVCDPEYLAILGPRPDQGGIIASPATDIEYAMRIAAEEIDQWRISAVGVDTLSWRKTDFPAHNPVLVLGR